jgi:hypothetical protein
MALQMPLPAAPPDNTASASEQIAQAVDQVSRAMQKLHGGTWRTLINHDTQFVVISRDFQQSPRSAEAL